MTDFNFATDDNENTKTGKKIYSSPSFFSDGSTPPTPGESAAAPEEKRPSRDIPLPRPPAPPATPASGAAEKAHERAPQPVSETAPPAPRPEQPRVPQPATEGIPAPGAEIVADPQSAIRDPAAPPLIEENHIPFSEIEEPGMQDEAPPPPQGGRAPIYGFLAIIVLLLSISFIWFVNPFPDIREGFEELFSTKAPEKGPRSPRKKAPRSREMDKTHKTAPGAAQKDTAPATPTAREWDYFVQVASQPRNPSAQVVANALKRQGWPATTEPEFVQRYKRTYYRVRVGPYPDRGTGLLMRDSLRRQYRDAFLDSARYDPTVPAIEGPPVLQPELGGGGQKQTASPQSGTSQSSPAKGFVVRVGSYRNRDVAVGEKNRLVQRGYPANMAVSMKTGSALYVVDVGPFSTRADAENYLRAIRNSVEKGAFLIEIPQSQKKASP